MPEQKATLEVTAPIFDVQRFSIHDGPGIRTLVFFKGCNLRCVWCQNPESQQAAPLISFNRNRCQNSLECLSQCGADAINQEGFRVNYANCHVCLKCLDACAYDALKVIGKAMTPPQLMAILEQDRAYYQSSGGGVTFSGGEPTLYPKFMERILKLCQAAAIHTNLETCGSFAFDRWQALLRYLDLIYFDLKVMNREQHQALTGFDNARILDNARQLVGMGYPVEFRVPLVQGYTDDAENLQAISYFLRSLGVTTVHLLQYHNMGESKIELIDGSQKKLGLPSYPQARFEEVKAYFGAEGFCIL